MSRFLPSLQQLLVFVIQRGETVFPCVIAFALLACVWSWRRGRRLIHYGAGGLFALIALLSLTATLFAHTVRGELREHTLDLRFRTLEEARTHTVADWRGKIVVVNFWATWCLPCRQELPSLAKLADAYRDREVVVITLTNEAADVVERWGDPSLDRTVRGLFADDTPPEGLASVVLQWRPVTLVLDPQSTVRRILLGPQTYETLEKAVIEAR